MNIKLEFRKRWYDLIFYKEWNIYHVISRLILKIRDYDRLEDDYGCVLDHATGGKMSKTNYLRNDIYSVIDDYQRECYHDDIKTDLLEILNTDNPLIEDIRSYVDGL